MHRIYRITSVGRPVDPSYPTNRALLWVLLAVMAGVSAGRLWSGVALWPSLLDGLLASLIAFGAWALTRELSPDDDPAAFLALAFALVFWWFAPPANLALLFSALMLARVVNRSTGLVMRVSDTLLVLGLVGYTIVRTQSVWLSFVAALAFLLDALLRGPRRLHFAVVPLLIAAPWLLSRPPAVQAFGAPHPVWPWLFAATAFIFSVAILRTRQIYAPGDVDGVPLNLTRVRAGMLMGLLAAVQTLLAGFGAALAAAPVWAALAAVGLAALRPRQAPFEGR